jgi:hypothetical protein
MRTVVKQRAARIVSFVSLIAFNVVIFASSLFTSAALADTPVKGKKGTIGGVDTCHCPDDSGECYCNY